MEKKIATSTISPTNEFGYPCKIDWFAISKDGQGKKLAKPMLSETLAVAKSLGYDKILLHTQTTTWLAAKIYLDFGFKPLIMEDKKGWQILNTIISHNKLKSISKLSRQEIFDERIINIKKQLDNWFKNYSYSVWYENGRNDVFVFDFNTNTEFSYKFFDNGKILKTIKDK